MNTFQSTVSSPRNQRIMFWAALAVLVAGIAFLIVKFAGGSDSTPAAPAQGFKPQLPPKTTSLTSANGGKITSYEQLPSEVKQAIVGFMPGVLHNNYGPSWKYTAPSITHGASQHKWATVDARSVIPLPGYTLKGVSYRLEEASTKEILVVLRMQPTRPQIDKEVPMRIGLTPYGTGDHKRWLVSYWMPATNFAKPGYTGDG
jgi:hypothetical protein